MHSLCMLKLTTTHPNGLTFCETRPGHTVNGLTYTMDPFIREERIRLSQILVYVHCSQRPDCIDISIGTLVAPYEVV